MRARAPRAVADLLVTAVPQLRDRLLELEIRRAWSAVVGADVARRARPQSLAAGCLTVVADNSPWLQELTLRSGELTERLRGRFAQIRSLRFVLGALEAPEAAPRERTRPAVPLDAAARRAIDEAASAIPDETLAAAARRLLTKAWRYPPDRGAVR
jgi:hypothetical protein